MSSLLDPTFLAEAVFSVGDLNSHIKRVLEADPILSDVAVSGEISNFKLHSSGHCYFSLKDERAQIRCCLWKRNVASLSFRPADGDKVIAAGSIDFYNARGEANFNVQTLNFAGQGAQFEAFERLKTELAADGLFDQNRKKSLPVLPRRIGVITSPTGAVIRDILNVLSRRYPLATLVLIPAAVQGFSAPLDLMRALSFAEAIGDLDVVIMARGGGSAEDLWCFNDEDLARAASAFPFPLISAIGHETDFTILDFVADRRAPTPSAAAEIVAPDVLQLLGYVRALKFKMAQSAAGEVRLARQKIEWLRRSNALSRPQDLTTEARNQVTALRNRAAEALKCRVKIERQHVEGARAQLRALDPRGVLERGYALISDAQSGAIISAFSDVKAGHKLIVTLQDGSFSVVCQ
ncbi:Exodeoxyribonuclease VII large subunit [Abditibacterium utsteinense]|uniref:Exodeoxyribonuclease 7 large subunit n=1 Tax=Abditibacterium utsteinense TaxID=1960156 RepID=A0A2S8SRE6_9BACT|nr:exodeoxyribonuclease VII large subunit [Abditibacterium utsteinense]PQV63381.1 Exodeoxyribonuclease VII large subunit [Abditibacterium utsteinense]